MLSDRTCECSALSLRAGYVAFNSKPAHKLSKLRPVPRGGPTLRSRLYIGSRSGLLPRHDVIARLLFSRHGWTFSGLLSTSGRSCAWAVAGLLGALTTTLAQTPDAILAFKTRDYRQTSATQLQERRIAFDFYASFPTPVSSATRVQLIDPGDVPVALRANSDGEHEYFQSFSSESALDARFPDGRYVLSVTGGSAASATSFDFAAGPALPPVRIVNFATLQALPNTSAVIQWESIAGAQADDFLSLEIYRPDQSLVYESTSLRGFDVFVSVGNLPRGVPLTGVLTYARLAVTRTNGGATGVAVGRGFRVQFPLLSPLPVPLISEQPQSQRVLPGARVFLSVSATNAISYQWKKDGVAIPGATAGNHDFEVAGVADAGRYTVDVTNSFGTVPSMPAEIVVTSALRMSPFAGTPRTAGSRDGRGEGAQFFSPWGVAVDAGGNLFAADTNNQTIRRITPEGVVTTLAGLSGQSGTTNGTGTAARFSGPSGIVIDPAGNLFVSELSSHRIRKITPAGVVTTLAGSGGPGSADGPGASAGFNSPRGLALDAAGNLYVADWNNDCIRKISADGFVSTLAGRAGAPGAVDGPGTDARFDRPAAVAVDPAGNVYVGGMRSAGIRRISPAGIVTTIAGIAGSFDSSRDGVGLDAHFSSVWALAFDPVGALYIVDSTKLRRMTFPDLTVTSVSGSVGFGYAEGIGAQIQFSGANGLAVDAAGTVYLADNGNHAIRKAVLVPGSDEQPLLINATPQAHTIAPGDSALLAVPTSGTETYRIWQRNGATLPGETGATLHLHTVRPEDAGTYRVVVGNANGVTASAPITVTVSGATAERGRLVNLAIRSFVAAGSDPLIVGMTISAGSATATRPVLLRGIGPSLLGFGVANAASDPSMTLFVGSRAMATNDDWGGGSALRESFAAVGAFPLAADSRDAATVDVMAVGNYTLQLHAQGAAAGVVLAEVYDLGPGTGVGGAPRLTNVSTRTRVGTGGDILIAGFVLGGTTSKTVLVRATGPSLAAFGVGDLLTDPLLEVRVAGGSMVASNDNWGGAPELSAAMNSVGAFRLSASTSRDAAVVLTLPPGGYTAQVSGVGAATGVVLLEIYELP